MGELRFLLQHERHERRERPPAAAAALERGEDLIAWFRSNRRRLPAPFTLRPGHVVHDASQFYASLEADLAAGPVLRFRRHAIPRQRWGAMLHDLADLRRCSQTLRECEHDERNATARH
jgi:hypothetical protein